MTECPTCGTVGRWVEFDYIPHWHRADYPVQEWNYHGTVKKLERVRWFFVNHFIYECAECGEVVS